MKNIFFYFLVNYVYSSTIYFIGMQSSIFFISDSLDSSIFYSIFSFIYSCIFSIFFSIFASFLSYFFYFLNLFSCFHSYLSSDCFSIISYYSNSSPMIKFLFFYKYRLCSTFFCSFGPSFSSIVYYYVSNLLSRIFSITYPRIYFGTGLCS